ncbi:nucleotidyltransferase substrate binding protein [Sulfurihydrogenibium sp.]|jgi:nucleotidyltransferase substrate binding protein (TIGR01987 family)|uniref:nucleotidyltransferase substrate binding protein n=1 Tax=Sulfurihydrogenibium sp. TaxID=2053621 RepID=UPI002614ECF3|nr:nucleotidyltransferase substrate binding protein [Sulfurihydrogenibium sp.]
MRKVEILQALENLNNALDRLSEAVKTAKTDLEIDGTIQRFEFSFELFWKTLKLVLKYYGVECNNPRSCIKEAFRNGLIDDDEIFLDMLEDRNLTSRIYDKQIANEIFERIKKFYAAKLLETVRKIESKI